MDEDNKVLKEALNKAIENDIKNKILNLLLGWPYYLCMLIIIIEILIKRGK